MGMETASSSFIEDYCISVGNATEGIKKPGLWPGRCKRENYFFFGPGFFAGSLPVA
jgi:hypothetical protein